MLSFLRKHQYGFMLVVAIVVIIAFTFFYDQNDRGANPRTQKAFSIYGKDYTQGDLQRFGSTLQLAQRLGLYEFIGALYGERLDGSPQDFIYNLIILRKEVGKLGIHASQSEIEAKIREMPAFSPGGSFDQAAFDNLKANLGSFGFTTEDLYGLIGDNVALERLRELLTASFTPTPLEIEDAFTDQYAKVSAYRLDFPAEKFAAEVEVTDDDIAKYYEEHKAELRSEPKRSIEYVHFTQPDFSTPSPALTPSSALIPAPEATEEAVPPVPTEETTPEAPETTPPATEEAVAPVTTEEVAPEPTETTEEVAPPVTSEEAAPEATEEESTPSCQGGDTETSDEEPSTEEAVADAPATTTTAPSGDAAAPTTGETPAPVIPEPPVTATPTETTPLPDAAIDLGAPTPGTGLDALDQSASLLDDPSLATPTIPAGPTPEERTAAMLEYNKFMDDFITETSVAGSDFKALAEARVAAAASALHGASYGSTELFSQADAPEDLKSQAALVRAIFTHPSSKPVSTPVRVADGFYIFRLTGDEAPHDLSLEEASEQIREILKKEKQIEAVKKAAADAKEKIMADVKGGAKFADAAKTAGFEATRIPSFTGNQGPEDVADFYTHLREPISKTAAGQISEPHVVENTAVLVYVASRVVPEDPENEARKKEVTENLVNQQYSRSSYSALMFKGWLDEVRKGAAPKPDDLGLGNSVF